MREQGRVITVHDGTVDVRMETSSAACVSCGACSQSEGETIMHGVADTHSATVGDTVEIEIPDSVRSRAAIAVFVVPVVALVLGYLAGFLLGGWLGAEPDIAGLLGALTSGNIAVLGVRLAERRLGRNERYSPRVSAIIARGHAPL